MALGLTACGTRLSQARIAADAAGNAGIGSSQLGGTSAGSPDSASGADAASTAGGAAGAAQGSASGPGGAAAGKTGSAAGSGLTGAAGTAGAAAGSVVTVGNVGTYSGVIGAIFTGAQQSIQMWASYTNAHGGLNGHPVKVITADDGGDPSTSQSLVEQMVTQDHVIAFVGNIVPLTVQASLSYLEKQHIPVIGVYSATQTDYSSPVLFPASTEINSLSDGNIKLALAAGKKNLGFLYCVEAPACTYSYNYLIKDGHARADGANPAYSSSFSLTQPSFTAQCVQARQAGVDYIFLGGDGNSLQRVARDCAAQGYNPLYEAVSLGVSATMQGDPRLEGMLATQASFPWMDSGTPAQAAYQEAIRKYAPGLVGSGASSNEWAAGQLAVAASKFLGANPTPAQFFQGLWTIKNNDLGGVAPPLTFNANGNASIARCYFAIQLKGGKFTDPANGKYTCP
jgi:branched-chain amino acid transport system substrate-binding protein